MTRPLEPPPIGPLGWVLESAVQRAQRFAETFLIPAAAERESVRIGQGVKLLFWIQSTDEDIATCERMWVLVTARPAGNTFAGQLQSTPDTPGTLTRGTLVSFTADHIAEIYDGPTGHPANPYRSPWR
jgi:hypothetical protein